MSIFGRVNVGATSVKTFKLTGGLNEQISGAELTPGELISCTNYLEQNDAYHGYVSLKGYERYNGMTAPSSVALDSPSPVDDTSRETARTVITGVPGGGPVTGVHIYQDKVYAFRDNVGRSATEMFVADATHGWSDGSTPDTAISGTSLDNGGFTRAVNGRFSEYASNAEVMLWVDGVSQPHVWNGTAVSQIDIGSILGAPFITTFPTHLGVWKNRLFLVYPNGHILFSEVGDPTAWDSSTGLAGEIFIGDTVTNVLEAPGGVLLFYTQNAIKMLTYGSTTNNFIFQLNDYPKGIGARQDTVLSLTGSVYFADDRGFSKLETTADFGGFSTDVIGRSVYSTYIDNINNLSGATVDRNTNRYFLFYDDAVTGLSNGLVFTFFKKRLKGATKISLLHKVHSLTEGSFSNGTSGIFFGSSNGHVYHFQSGTSFDGSPIATGFTTSYHYYNSMRNWKRFRRLSFEIEAEDETVFQIGTGFDYESINLKKPIDQSTTIDRGVGSWGTAVWGSFIWGADIINRTPIYINGYGSNMAVSLSTSSKYKTEHTVYNITTDFSQNSIQR